MSSAPTFSVEFFPPKDEVGETRLWNALDALNEASPDFVSVTYGAGGSSRDHYELVPDDVLKIFQDDGWDIGTYVMNIRVLQSRLDRIDRSLAYPRITEESMGRFLEEREKVINKMRDYEQRLVSLNPLKFKFNHYDTLERDVQGQ